MVEVDAGEGLGAEVTYADGQEGAGGRVAVGELDGVDGGFVEERREGGKVGGLFCAVPVAALLLVE